MILVGKTTRVKFGEWSSLIQQNFETYFWVNSTPVPEKEPKPELINRRGIYKDSHNASQFWADYQLRPNAPVTMVVVSYSSDFTCTFCGSGNTQQLLPLMTSRTTETY